MCPISHTAITKIYNACTQLCLIQWKWYHNHSNKLNMSGAFTVEYFQTRLKPVLTTLLYGSSSCTTRALHRMSFSRLYGLPKRHYEGWGYKCTPVCRSDSLVHLSTVCKFESNASQNKDKMHLKLHAIARSSAVSGSRSQGYQHWCHLSVSDPKLAFQIWTLYILSYRIA